MFRFWRRIFGVGFAIGAVAGAVITFQMGLNWGAYGAKTGPIMACAMLPGLVGILSASVLTGARTGLVTPLGFAALAALIALAGLVAKPTSAGMPAARHRSGARVQERGTWSRRPMAVCPAFAE